MLSTGSTLGAVEAMVGTLLVVVRGAGAMAASEPLPPAASRLALELIAMVFVLFANRWLTQKAPNKARYASRVRSLGLPGLSPIKARGVDIGDITPAQLEHIHRQIHAGLRGGPFDITIQVIQGCVLLAPSVLYVESEGAREGTPQDAIDLVSMLPLSLREAITGTEKAQLDMAQGSLSATKLALPLSLSPQPLSLHLDLPPSTPLPTGPDGLPALRPTVWANLAAAQVSPLSTQIRRAAGQNSYVIHTVLPPLPAIESLTVMIGVLGTAPSSNPSNPKRDSGSKSESDTPALGEGTPGTPGSESESAHISKILPLSVRIPVVAPRVARDIQSEGEGFASDFANLIRILGANTNDYVAPAFRGVAAELVQYCSQARLPDARRFMEALLSDGPGALQDPANLRGLRRGGFLGRILGGGPPSPSHRHLRSSDTGSPFATTMSPYTLRFSDPELESEFFRQYYTKVLPQHTLLSVLLGVYFHVQFFVFEGRLPPLSDTVNVSVAVFLTYVAVFRRRPGVLYPLLASLQGQLGPWARAAQTDKFCHKIGMKDKPHLIFSAALYLALMTYGFRTTFFPWGILNVVGHASAGIMISTFLPSCRATGFLSLGINLNTCIGTALPAYFLYKAERARRLRFLEEARKRAAKRGAATRGAGSGIVRDSSIRSTSGEDFFKED